MPKPTRKPNGYCFIRATMHLPLDVDVLDLDWSPAPPLPRIHFPNRVIAHRQGVRIAREESFWLQQRLAELGTIIREEQKFLQFQKELDGLEQRVLAALGVK
jgi:hypothetical protein